ATGPGISGPRVVTGSTTRHAGAITPLRIDVAGIACPAARAPRYRPTAHSVGDATPGRVRPRAPVRIRSPAPAPGDGRGTPRPADPKPDRPACPGRVQHVGSIAVGERIAIPI